jgi:hypothetical protein
MVNVLSGQPQKALQKLIDSSKKPSCEVVQDKSYVDESTPITETSKNICKVCEEVAVKLSRKMCPKCYGKWYRAELKKGIPVKDKDGKLNGLTDVTDHDIWTKPYVWIASLHFSSPIITKLLDMRDRRDREGFVQDKSDIHKHENEVMHNFLRLHGLHEEFATYLTALHANDLRVQP